MQNQLCGFSLPVNIFYIYALICKDASVLILNQILQLPAMVLVFQGKGRSEYEIMR